MKNVSIFTGMLALLVALFGVRAVADDHCNLSLGAADNMQFSTKAMAAPVACENVTVTLNHTGVFPKNAMGHNWVLTTEADFKGVAMDGGSAGLKNNYVKEGDTRVIAMTAIIGGGESTSVTFSTEGLTAGTAYTFFCSFPGHWGIMKGTFTLS